jgi:hypothetical protein
MVSRVVVSGLHPDSLAARVMDFMRDNRLGLEGMAAAADVIAADCRFNARVAAMKASNFTEDRLLEFLDVGGAADRQAKAAMNAYSADGQEEALCREMAAVAQSLNARPD